MGDRLEDRARMERASGMAYVELKKLKAKDIKRAFEMMKELALSIISMDKSKEVSMETVEQEFNDFRALEMLLSDFLSMANE